MWNRTLFETLSSLFVFRITRELKLLFEVVMDITKDSNGELYRGFSWLKSIEIPTMVYCTCDRDLWSMKYERGDGGVSNVTECTMTVEYRHKIESGKWETGQE